MSGIHTLFKVGQIVEAKSFEKGYRGAWFRCKVTDIYTRKNEFFYKLEYTDYPGEKIHTTKLYQKRVARGDRHLMLRPKFPPMYHQSEVTDIKDELETTLVVFDTWKVGDLVDWWTDFCYWSGTIVEIKGDGNVKVELHPSPIGEGGSYDAHSSDIRPSLDWSPDNGWTMPFSKDEKKKQGVRLIKPTYESNQIIGCNDGKEEEHIDGATKRKVDEDLPLNISTSNAIEAAVLDLEELVTRIKWLKRMLGSNSERSSCTTKSTWEFVEHRPSSTRRF